MPDKNKPIPNDVLPEQIVEDEDGNMHVVPADWLVTDKRERAGAITENELGVENMENDLPCADVTAYGDEYDEKED